jgi:hypothetical protein
MKSEEDNEWYFFVYDTKLGTWHKEDATHVLDFCTCRNELYFIDAETNEIKSVMGSGTEESNDVEFFAETGTLGVSAPDKKYVSRLLFRMSLGIGSVVHIDIQYDSCGEWEHLSTVNGTVLRTFTLPVKPKRCDHYRLRIYGRGEIKLYSITKTIEQGSDME